MVPAGYHRSVLAIPLAAGLLVATGAGADGTVAADHEAPEWLVEAEELLHRGIDAYYEAAFEEALTSLEDCAGALVSRHDEYPVSRDTIRVAVVHLILTLHALEREQEALELARGLAEVSAPPWTGDMQLSPAAAAYVEELAATVPPHPTGTLRVLAPQEGCVVEVDGREAEPGQGVELPAGVHWIRLSCDGVPGDHHRVTVTAGEVVELDLSGLELEAVKVDEDGAPEETSGAPPGTAPGGTLLLEEGRPASRPWYGDAWNVVLQGAGVVMLGVGAGLLAGAMALSRKAMKTTSLRYVELSGRAFDMQVSGWTLLGAGAVSLAVGVVRMAIQSERR
jgi:hypothetical protein